MNKLSIHLLFLFIFAMFVRLLYFPDNIYFGFDQARDAYAALDLARGDFRIVGPPTSAPGLYHGVLYYYILAPVYFFAGGGVEVVAALMRIINAFGVFLIFCIGWTIFNKKVGFLSALLFAISFEETQFAIYMGNPSLAVLSILLLYLGLAMVIFKNKKIGLPIAALGLGCSIQFQFALLYLVVPAILIITLFRKFFLKLPFKIWVISGGIFLLSISTFILAEIKYNFRTLHSLTSLNGGEKYLENIFNTYLFVISRMGRYNIVGDNIYTGLILITLLLVFIYFLSQKEYAAKLFFLSLWFFSIITTILISGGVDNVEKNVPLYYPNIGVSVALLLFLAFILERVSIKRAHLAVILTALIIYSNLQLILNLNSKGTISEIDVQQGMLLSSEKQAIEYMYNSSGGKTFAVKAITMPFDINTTWSYLFEWYGKSKYGYLPLWNGKNAEGFPGHLKIQEAQEGLPDNRFVIIEPLRGVPGYLADNFLKEENYFTKIIEEKSFGEFKIQKRVKF